MAEYHSARRQLHRDSHLVKSDVLFDEKPREQAGGPLTTSVIPAFAGMTLADRGVTTYQKLLS